MGNASAMQRVPIWQWTSIVLFPLMLLASGCTSPVTHLPRPLGKDSLTKAEQQTLLVLARRTLVAVATGKQGRPLLSGLTLTDRLRRKQGVFVALLKPPLLGLFGGHPEGRLRACAGHLAPLKPLYEAVIFDVRRGGKFDPRFTPVERSELADISIELSVVTPPRKVRSPKEILIGQHGIELRQGNQMATFLPYFPPSMGWDRQQTLTKLCKKAGLDGDAWKSGEVSLSVYRAHTFTDKVR